MTQTVTRTMIRTISLIVALVACSPTAPTAPKIDPAACCGSPDQAIDAGVDAPGTGLVGACSSSSDCGHNSNGCNYCYGGQCSCTLPAEPLPKSPGAVAP